MTVIWNTTFTVMSLISVLTECKWRKPNKTHSSVSLSYKWQWKLSPHQLIMCYWLAAVILYCTSSN